MWRATRVADHHLLILNQQIINNDKSQNRAIEFEESESAGEDERRRCVEADRSDGRQEAEEKANEVSVSAEEEFNIEKLQLVEAEKKKIKQEYELKEKQVEVRKKIEYSMQLNASRIKVLQAQDDVVNSMKEAASKELLHISQDRHLYKKLLNDFIVQSLLRLKEPSVLLRCRKADQNLVEDVLDTAKEEYAEKANVHFKPEIFVDGQVYLPPAPMHHNAHGPFCCGGIVMASRDGKIVCENTLDASLDVVFRKKLPQIRKELCAQIAI